MTSTKPVIVDTSLHLAFTVTYAIYVVTGILAAFALPPSLEAVGGREVTVFWILGLGVTSAFALLWSLRERWQRREMITGSLLLTFLLTYPLSVLIHGAAKGNLDWVVLSFLTLALSPLVGWRVIFFFRKFRKPKNG